MFNPKSIKSVFAALAVALVVFTGCSDITSDHSSIAYGSIVLSDGSDSRAVDVSELTSANVSVICPDKTVINANNPVSISGGQAKATVTGIPVGKNRVVKVESNVSGAVLYALVDEVVAGENNVTVNWDSTALGSVYYNLIQRGTNVSSFGSAEKTSILSKIPDVHAVLVNTAAIAEDYPGMAGSYVLDYGTVEVNATGAAGFTVQITDPASKKVVVESDSQNETLKAYPGTWKVKVYNDSESAEDDVKIAAGETTTVNVGYGAAITDKIVVKVAKNNSDGYDHIWAWKGSTNYTTSKKWPGDALADSDNDGYYEYTINALSSDVILDKANGSSAEKQTNTISITEPGAYIYNGSSFEKTSGAGIEISVVNPVIVEKPTYTATGTALLTGNFTVNVTSNAELTSGSITIGGVTKPLSIGRNTFSVADFATAAGTYTYTGSIANKAGTTAISGSVEVSEAPAMDADWNNLRIYQVMVSSFMDGDSSIGYSYAYGPSKTYDYYTGSSEKTLTGGDLQGIINAADYIADLGVNAIWMTPIFDSSSGENNEYLNSTGYFCYDYFKIDPKFGTNEKFAELVETYHSKGIYVILDGVFGHWNGAGVKASPTGKTAVRKNGQYKACAYPDSLEFFKEVAQYWIKEYKIDGWRFDQCYQVGNGDKEVGDNSYTNDHNYWYEIRTAIAEAAADNAQAGEEWGTLGYTVGEHWNGDASKIQRGSVAPGANGEGYGLQSCFDFPSRYRLVQTMAQEEGTNTATDFGAAMEYTYGTFEEKGYVHPEGYYPNLFFTNHDLVRYGNLLNWKFSLDPTKDEYFTRHKLMLAVLAGYSGPITTYYGDEWGAIVKGYDGPGSLGAYNDNMARSNGKINGFTEKEADLIGYYKRLMSARDAHPALWKGEAETVSSTETTYVVKKTYGSETVYICFNNGNSATTFSASGTDLVTGANYSGTVSVPALSAVFVLAR